jgi:hypothetical protein
MKHIFIFLSLLFVIFTVSSSQEFNIGGSVQTQSVVKGIQLCKTPVFGGYLEYVYDNTSISTCVTSDFSGNYAENVLIIKYTCAPVWSAITDYYYPYSSNGFSNFSGKNTGSHYIEVSIGGDYKGVEILLSSNIYNDSTFSPYAQLSYSLIETDGLLGFFTGFGFGKTFFYNTNLGGPQAVYIGFKYNRKNLTLTWYVNPSADLNGIIVAYNL